MPQPRKHSSHAERQAAYRKRQWQMLNEHLDGKKLPPLPAVSTIPGTRRWKQAMEVIERQLTRVQAEMEFYYHERSERWQQSDRAQEFEERLENLQAILELVSDWNA